MSLFPDLHPQRAVRGGVSAVPVTWPFGDLKMGHYGVILCDDPWRFENYSAAGEAKNPMAHYDCMTMDDLRALPVRDLAAPDAVLVMWGIWPMAAECADLMRQRGFTPKSGGAWGKQSKTGAKIAFGTGYIYRSASEFWLLGTIGNPPVLSHGVRNFILAPVREHSRKPDQMHADLERLYPGPRCELFAREKRDGWDIWGNQTDKFLAAETA
jgi:N6-adenosine-specific RNA methylase IME4